MKPRSNTPILIAVVLVALGGIVVLNRAQYDSRPRTTAEIQEEMQAQMAKTEAGAAAGAAAPRAPSAEMELASLPPSDDFGTPKQDAQHTLVLGYEWTPEVQADPQKATKGLTTFRKMLDEMNQRTNLKVHYQLVNVDVKRDQQPGIWLNGRQIGELNIGTLESSSSHLGQSIMREIQTSSPQTKSSRSTKS